jgi:phospholipase D1/2
MSSLFDKMHAQVHKIGYDIKNKLNIADVHSHTHTESETCHEGAHDAHVGNRYVSFCPQREGNDVKWYVDACGYMWAVSRALEQARESIWILDCKRRERNQKRIATDLSRVALPRAVSKETSCEERTISH